ncbi:hypothetical protein [Streptomyces viridochromogenes]|uniref:hypothetical protein n=1 Tax=Streptomyces viridochromogenes TaxID=1938 RepID=UPI00069E61CA|nr:hypothetical protein [Streptomyces viridochromogenes]KOG22015.1 hypothetical protein ADK36_13845 [Streptomyces viridochromogenes]
MDDFEIRQRERRSGVAPVLDMDGPLFVVWDIQLDKRVPFGNYRRHDQAVARILAERRKRRGVAEPSSCAECGIPKRPHGRRFTLSAGVHTWQAPDQALILRRMRTRRELRQRG